jgi:hypothetical protein
LGDRDGRAGEADEPRERKVADPESWFPAHVSSSDPVTCSGSGPIVARQLIDRKGIIDFNTRFTYGPLVS